MKTYKAKSSANRAAKKLVNEFEEILSFEVEEIGGLWSINLVVDTASYDEVLLETANGVVVDGAQLEDLDINHPANRDLKVSIIGKPCNQVWEIAIQANKDAAAAGLSAPARKDVIAACVDQGVAYNTARTQYQAWFKASKA